MMVTKQCIPFYESHCLLFELKGETKFLPKRLLLQSDVNQSLFLLWELQSAISSYNTIIYSSKERMRENLEVATAQIPATKTTKVSWDFVRSKARASKSSVFFAVVFPITISYWFGFPALL